MAITAPPMRAQTYDIWYLQLLPAHDMYKPRRTQSAKSAIYKRKQLVSILPRPPWIRFVLRQEAPLRGSMRPAVSKPSLSALRRGAVGADLGKRGGLARISPAGKTKKQSAKERKKEKKNLRKKGERCRKTQEKCPLHRKKGKTVGSKRSVFPNKSTEDRLTGSAYSERFSKTDFSMSVFQKSSKKT